LGRKKALPPRWEWIIEAYRKHLISMREFQAELRNQGFSKYMIRKITLSVTATRQV